MRCAYALRILNDVYRSTMVDVLSMPVLTGHKTARERFAGANRTWTCEGMMGDGKALQMGTSHELGQNFARPFDITFTNASGTLEYVWQTSWGVSTRLVGALVMGHGDDFGLRLPPALAPAQVVVLVVKDSPEVGAAAAALVAELDGGGPPGPPRRPHRHQLRPAQRGLGAQGRPRAGRGGPTRPGRGQRHRGHPPPAREAERRPSGAVAGTVAGILAAAGPELLAEATEAREARTADAASLEEAIEAGSVGFARVRLGALGPDGEDRLAQHALSIRCLQRPDGSLAEPGDPEDGSHGRRGPVVLALELL